ncbi:uncharacterized protein M6B38_400705 [Iris pallida]|uniref:Uncharacterized protein n=1 Tax=Iris pallida TaxID=29817 RepID=A0AAX6FTC1_IRIPA|nr:uncharacterized protein M6B38_400705 [Iris pallida]
MRLLEFVPCGRRATSPEPEDAAAPPPPPSCTVEKEKRRRRSSAAAPAAAWRPSLGAISESGSALQAAKARTADRRAAPAKPAPRTTKPAAVVARPRSDRDDIRHFSVPAFAPTAFMF